jgi:hypothetical protein
MAALLIADPQVAAGLLPLVSMRQNSATASAKLGEKMGQFVTQSSMNFVRMLNEARV